MVGSFRDLLRTKSGLAATQEFVRGKRGIRSLINVTNSERMRTQLYRLERQGVSTARNVLRKALRSV